MSQSISLWGATYSNVPAVTLPKSPSGTATFTDVTDTTATASDVASGKYFYTSAGVKTAGTGSGGGGGSDVQTGSTYEEVSSASSSISFYYLDGEPTSFIVYFKDDLSTPSGTPYKVAAVVYDGTSLHGQTITNTNNSQVTYDGSSFSHTYNNDTLTITSTGAYFQSGMYYIDYTYGGTAGNIKTADVQVGSGATSITFTGLTDEPLYWSCIFKSNFSTSSGYQRVIWTEGNKSSVWGGMAMDSAAHWSNQYWSCSYNNGSLTITSQGTNAGGYFHQPGYYQLTYAVSGDQSLQTKTVYASTSTQNVTADEGYTGLSKVVVGAVSQTNLVAGNIKSGTTVSISNGNGNLWSVTGTYTGGGGSSMNVQTNQSTSRTTSTTLASVNSLTCTTAGTYDVYWTCTRSSTSGTWSSQLYVGGSASGSEQTTWSNHVQNVKLTNVTIAANQTVAVYAKSRGSNYYAYAPQLTIVQTS